VIGTACVVLLAVVADRLDQDPPAVPAAGLGEDVTVVGAAMTPSQRRALKQRQRAKMIAKKRALDRLRREKLRKAAIKRREKAKRVAKPKPLAPPKRIATPPATKTAPKRVTTTAPRRTSPPKPAQPANLAPNPTPPSQPGGRTPPSSVPPTPPAPVQPASLAPNPTPPTPPTPPGGRPQPPSTPPGTAAPLISPPPGSGNPGGRVSPPRELVAGSDLLPPDDRQWIEETPTREFLPQPDPGKNFRPREVLITFSGRPTGVLIDELAQQYGLRHVDSVFVRMLDADVHRYRVRVNRTVAETVALIKTDNRVVDAQPNLLFQLNGSADSAAQQNTAAGPQYALAKLSVSAAHERATGKQIRIAVIDTGVDQRHPGLEGAVVASYDATANGRAVPHLHGTAIAGIIGARATLRGVAPSAQILAVRAFSASSRTSHGEADSMSLARAMNWSEIQGVQIINMSFAGPKDLLLEKLIEAAHSRGIIMVAASGNAGAKAAPLYPAAHKAVIAVTATDWADKLYKQANQGRHITIAAPGVDILVLAPSGKFGMMSGTSMASAHIAGLAALLLEHNPSLSPNEVKALITQSAIDLGPDGVDTQFGAGRADAVGALDAELSTAQAKR